jgi:AbrB family looped-hinge helix DNA binding protein
MGRPVTTLSTKGQVILPKAIRDHWQWGPGTRLLIEETPEGILLRKEDDVPETRLEDVVGMAKYDGPPATVEDMNRAVQDEVRRRYARHRY